MRKRFARPANRYVFGSCLNPHGSLRDGFSLLQRVNNPHRDRASLLCAVVAYGPTTVIAYDTVAFSRLQHPRRRISSSASVSRFLSIIIVARVSASLRSVFRSWEPPSVVCRAAVNAGLILRFRSPAGPGA